MAATNTTIPAGKVTTGAGITLTASTVDTVTFADDCDQVEVMSDGAADVLFTVDGTDPSTAANYAAYRIPSGGPAQRTVVVQSAGGTVVKLVSSGTPKYTVTRIA